MSETQALAIAEPSALDLAKQGALLPPGVTTSDLAPPDEDDMVGIPDRHPIIRANAKWGTYPIAGEEARDAPKFRDGLALARTDSRILFPANDENRPRYQALKLAPPDAIGKDGKTPEQVKGLADTVAKWICSCTNLRTGHARLNPQLTPAEKEAAAKAQLGGATGKGCSGCWMGNPQTGWAEDTKGKFQLCKEGINMLWLDSQAQEPTILQFISGTSVKALKDFFAKHFKRGKVSISIYKWMIRLGMANQTKGGKDYCVAVPALGPESSPEEMEQYRKLRADLVTMLDSTVEASADTFGLEDLEPEPAAPAPVGDALDPIDPRDPLPDGTPSEFDLF